MIALCVHHSHKQGKYPIQGSYNCIVLIAAGLVVQFDGVRLRL
jgi:hypothetical protein